MLLFLDLFLLFQIYDSQQKSLEFNFIALLTYL